MSPCGNICVRMCVWVCAGVYMNETSGFNILFRIYANPLNALHLYAHKNACKSPLICHVGLPIYLFLTHKASNSCI